MLSDRAAHFIWGEAASASAAERAVRIVKFMTLAAAILGGAYFAFLYLLAGR